MKKTILAAALVMAVGFAGYNVAQAGFGPGGCNGPGGWGAENGPTVTYEEMEQFHNDTSELRRQLFEKRAEYFEVVNQEDPDKELAKTLWSEMYDLQSEMHQKAEAAGMWQGNTDNRGGFRGQMMMW